ncbi:MAG TPA: hypothetical protein VIU11_19170, partial [Nakamurella sp.]
PADWPVGITTEILEVLLVRPIAQVRLAEAIPAVHGYVDFLIATGRWKQQNNPQAVRDALDRAQSAADNAIPPDWRHRFDRDDRWYADIPYVDDFGDLEPDDEFPGGMFARGLDDFLDTMESRPDVPIAVTVPPAPQEWAVLSALPLIGHLRAVAEWATPGRKLTGDGGLSRQDLEWWRTRHRLPIVQDGEQRDLQVEAALQTAWRVAQAAGLVSVQGRRATRGRAADLLDADPVTAVTFARLLVHLLVTTVLDLTGAADSLQVATLVGAETVLTAMCSPGGQDLDRLPRSIGVTDPDVPDEEYPARMVATAVRHRLALLACFGVITGVRGRVSVPDGLRPTVVRALEAPGSPLRITLAPGAAPLPDIDAEPYD